MKMKRRFFGSVAAITILFCLGVSLPAGQNPGMNTDIVINEIMQNPSAVSDANGEWFEVYNPGDVDIDINGWTIHDNGNNVHVIDNGDPLLVPAKGYLVLGKNRVQEENGGVGIDYQYTDFSLGNGDDEIVLFDTDSVEVDRVEYDGGPEFPDPSGASMELNSPELDNNIGTNWHNAYTPYGDGDFGTPGGPNSIPLTITTAELPNGAVGFDYTETLEAEGGVQPYTWELVTGALPEGLSLDSTGVISGVPAAPDTQTFTVEVGDAVGNETTKELSLVIAAFQINRGDVDSNGEVNVLDVLAVVNSILGLQELEGLELECADCNADGGVDILDALGIVNVILGVGECEPS